MLRRYCSSLVFILILSLSYGFNRIEAQSDLVLDDQEIDVFYDAITDFSLMPEGGVAPYSYEIVQPLNGVVDNTGSDFYYLSEGGFVGQESFEVTVTDNLGATDTALITINVLQPDFVPDQTIGWLYNTAFDIFIFPSQGIAPFTTSADEVTNGTLQEVTSEYYVTYTYTPDDGFIGTETFTITLTDSTGITDSGIYSITFPEPNFIDPQTLNSFYNQAVTFDASTIEIPDNPTIDITQPANGTVTGDLSGFTYTPNDGFFGTDTFSITVNDSYGASDTAIFDVFIKEPIILNSVTNTDLLQAIEQANSDPGKDTIVLLPSTVYSFTESYELFAEGHLALPEITDSLYIIGNDSTFMRQSTEQFGFFAVRLNRVDFHIRDVSIANANADYEGGAIFYDSFSGSLDIQNVMFVDNVAYYGGAIQIIHGEARIDDSQFINNSAYLSTIPTAYGGAIAIYSNQNSRPSLTVTNSYFDSNRTGGNNAGGSGGAIYAVNVHFIAQNNIFIRNGISQNGRGGAMYLGGSSDYSFQVNNNCILDNDLAQVYVQLNNSFSHDITLDGNWWGSSRGVLPNDMDGNLTDTQALSEGILGCPTAEDFTLDIEPDVLTNITLNADASTPVSYTLDTLPEFTTVSGTPPNINILNDKVYYGPDEFSYRIQTTDNLTATGYVTLNLLPDLDVPLITNPSSLNSQHQEPLSFILDISGGVYPYTTELISTSASGIALFETSAYNPINDAYEVEWLYLPMSDFSSTETLTFAVNDANGNSIEATVNITVGEADPPTIFVDTTVYEYPLVDNGNCTMNEALEAARTDTPVDACNAGRADIVDIIFVPAGIYEGSFGVDTEVIIRGAGKTETIFDGNSDSRVFYITGRNEFAQFEHLMIRNGWAGRQSGYPYRRGGGIYFDGAGALRIFDVVFFGHYAEPEAAAIYTYGDGRTDEQKVYFESYNSFYIANEAITGGHAIESGYTVGTLINNGFADNGNIDTYQDSYQVVISAGAYERDPIHVMHNCFPNYGTDSINVIQEYLDERYNWYDNSNEPPLAICDELLALRPILFQDVAPQAIIINPPTTGLEGEIMTEEIFIDDLPPDYVTVTTDIGTVSASSLSDEILLWEYIPPDNNNTTTPTTVTITATNTLDATVFSQNTFEYTAFNQRPRGDVTIEPNVIAVGDTATINISNVTDPGPVDTQAGFTYSYTCDATLGWQVLNSPESSHTCQYDTPGTYQALAQIIDKDGVDQSGIQSYNLEITVTALEPLASLAGSFTTQARTGDYNALNTTVTLYPVGSNIASYTFTPVTSGVSSGTFVVEGILPDTYQVALKVDGALQGIEIVTLTTGANTVNFGNLPAGDANGDNIVTILDFSLLASSFNKQEGDVDYNAAADFNGDNIVSTLDFSLLASNFNIAGDVPSLAP